MRIIALSPRIGTVVKKHAEQSGWQLSILKGKHTNIGFNGKNTHKWFRHADGTLCQADFRPNVCICVYFVHTACDLDVYANKSSESMHRKTL